MMKHKQILSVFLLALFVAACQPPMLASDMTVVPATATEAAAMPPATSGATAAPTLESATATPLPTAQVQVVEVASTDTPRSGDAKTELGDLPLGQKEHYVNLTFGYHLRHPADWYTGFGNRPLLVSFSNLDPGTHNRISMRAEGCLVEIRALTNVQGLTLQAMRPQLALPFNKVEDLKLGGEPALRVWPRDEEDAFDSEWIYAEHSDRLFLLTFEYATGAGENCRPGWEKMLTTWEWFEPELAVYRNPAYGYAISYPNWWYSFNPTERGISIGSQDPTGMTDVVAFITREEMLIETNVLDNPEGLPLKEWLADQYWEINLTNDIPLDGMVGVRVLRQGPSPEIREMSGYFQGPHGRIYEITCLFPAEKRLEFQSIANAVIYSFSF